MKKQQFVHIPVGHICITESEFLHMHKQLIHFHTELRLRTSECCSLDDEVEGLKKQLAEAEKKAEKLEDVLKSRTDAMIYWNKEYEKLQKQLQELVDGGAGNAEAKTT